MNQLYAEKSEQTCQTGCPFYACHISASKELRVMVQHREDSNQCGLIVSSLAPCRMEMAETDPDWKNCPLRNQYGERQMFESLRDLRVFPKDSKTGISFDEWIARFSSR